MYEGCEDGFGPHYKSAISELICAGVITASGIPPEGISEERSLQTSKSILLSAEQFVDDGQWVWTATDCEALATGYSLAGQLELAMGCKTFEWYLEHHRSLRKDKKTVPKQTCASELEGILPGRPPPSPNVEAHPERNSDGKGKTKKSFDKRDPPRKYKDLTLKAYVRRQSKPDRNHDQAESSRASGSRDAKGAEAAESSHRRRKRH